MARQPHSATITQRHYIAGAWRIRRSESAEMGNPPDRIHRKVHIRSFFPFPSVLQSIQMLQKLTQGLIFRGKFQPHLISFAGNLDFSRLGAGTPNPLGGAREHPGYCIKTAVSHTNPSTTPKTIYRV
jgi:hypothetical protein